MIKTVKVTKQVEVRTMTKEQALKKFENELQIAKDAIEEGYTFDQAVEIASENIEDIDTNGEYFFDLCCEEIDGLKCFRS